MVQWLGLSTFTAVSLGSVPGQGTESQKPRDTAQKKKYWFFFPSDISNHLSGLFFPKHRVPYPVFVLNSFQGVLFQAATAVADDLILVELDGGQPSLFYPK